jgi:hypothetical protein
MGVLFLGSDPSLPLHRNSEGSDPELSQKEATEKGQNRTFFSGLHKNSQPPGRSLYWIPYSVIWWGIC